MQLTRILAAAAALSLASAPAIAGDPIRASAPTEHSSELIGNSSILIAVGIFAVLLVAILATGGGEDNDAPTSP
jgi:hypothetical protein